MSEFLTVGGFLLTVAIFLFVLVVVNCKEEE